MISKIVVLLFVLLVAGEVFSRNLDSRNIYDVTYGNDNTLQDENGNVQYEIVFAQNGVISEDIVVQQNPQTIEEEQSVKKRLMTTEKSLCVGSVTLMAICY